MRKQTDSLQQFISLRSSLQQERTSLQRRLRELDAAMGEVRAAAAPREMARPARISAPARARATQGARGQNALSLREAISKATARAPLSVRDIVDSVQKLGYRFQSSNPINSVGAYLYGPEGKKHFKRGDGKFSPK